MRKISLSAWAFILLIALLTAPTWAQTSVANMPISCARADGLQANAAACTDNEQFQRPASADDVVLACAKATACGWFDAELTWRKWSTVPATATVVVCPLSVAPGPMNCPGAQSPVWGGLTYVAKSLVTVASAPPTAAQPPAEGTAIRIVSWTNTATCAITATRVQASLQPDFAAWRQWEAAGAATNMRITTAPNETALYWRAATVCGTAVSDWSTPIARTEAEWAIETTPPCEPAPSGVASSTATEAWYDFGPVGSAMYYACKLPDGTWKDAGTYGVNDYACIGRYAAATFILDPVERVNTKKAIWAECVRTKPGDEEFRPKWEALRAAHRPSNTPPPISPSYVVRPNGAYTTRPAYSIVGGSRTSTVAGRVGILASPGVATACDCGKFSSGAEPNLYCSVEGRPNIATADPSDTLGASAAVCAKAPTAP